MKTYLTLEKSIPHKSNYDGSLYKSYVTSFFSYTQSHHTINDFYDEEGNVYIPEVYSFCEKKVDPDTHEMFVRADVEFEDGLNMDFLLHKPLYFKEPEWFHDLTNEKINKIVCSYSDWDILDLLDNKTSNTTINISIFDDGMIQIEETKENQNPLILTYQVNKTYIQQFFEAMKQNLGSETTYDPSCVAYITHFFSYTKARHKIQYLYDENNNVHSVELYEIIDRKVDPDTNELFVRAEFEFEDDEDMDAFLHKPLYFKEPEWFHDLTHEEIVQLNCVFEQYEPFLGSLIERKNVYINVNGTVQIDDKIYHLSEPKICEFFYEIKINLGSEKTYQPLLCGGGSSRYILHLKSGKSIEYSGDYALCDGTPYGCKRYTKLIVDDLLKQVIDSF